MPLDSVNVPLEAAGTTYIGIMVTAADGSNNKLYTVDVTTAPAPATDTSDAKLAAADAADATATGLSLGAGVTLSPSYNPDKIAYTASVPYITGMVTVVANSADDGALVMVTSDMDDDIDDDVATDEGNMFSETSKLSLEVGANVITIKVDAADAIATKTYTVTVTRASATASSDANLSSLNLSNVTLSPAFDPGKTGVHRIGAELREFDDREGEDCRFGCSG